MTQKEKAPKTAATVNSAKINNHIQDTTENTKRQAFAGCWSELEEASFEAAGIVEIIDALSIATEYSFGYDKGLRLLASILASHRDRMESLQRRYGADNKGGMSYETDSNHR